MSRDEQLSRKLTSTLRHRALELGLDITEEGWVRLCDVLSLDMFAGSGFSIEDVEAMVAQRDQKRRFSLEWWEGELWIRANQGHTIRAVRDDMLLRPVLSAEEVPCCVHGTYLFVWEQILRSGGLSRMTRNHIHCAPQPPGRDRVISGMRSDCEVAIFISVASAMAAGIQFFRSANEVILTPGDERGMLPTVHFERVVQLSDNALLWPQASEGGQVRPPAQLPQRFPQYLGRGRRW
mmetsp:Transcript_90132/g.278835  ORF Transcript_90132/g.278835 Transcript_90132/m.278835 type:complete len:236 (+) Transcript_90132:277-984(+)